MTIKNKTDFDTKNASSEIQLAEEVPSLVSMNEFLSTISRKYKIETLGGFAHWIRCIGKIPRMSAKQWNDKLNEFMTRKV